jgi:hypothetical protein
MRRVLDPSLSKRDQTLLLLYSSGGWVEETELVSWVEYSNLTQYRNRVIVPLHESRLVEYDKNLRRVQMTPLGSKAVEEELLPRYKL